MSASSISLRQGSTIVGPTIFMMSVGCCEMSTEGVAFFLPEGMLEQRPEDLRADLRPVFLGGWP